MSNTPQEKPSTFEELRLEIRSSADEEKLAPLIVKRANDMGLRGRRVLVMERSQAPLLDIRGGTVFVFRFYYVKTIDAGSTRSLKTAEFKCDKCDDTTPHTHAEQN